MHYDTPALRLLPRGFPQVLINCRNNRKLLARVKVRPRVPSHITARLILILARIVLRKLLHAQGGEMRRRVAAQ